MSDAGVYLGQVLQLSDGLYVATATYWDGRVVLTKIPVGETVFGMRRTWQPEAQPTRVIQRCNP